MRHILIFVLCCSTANAIDVLSAEMLSEKCRSEANDCMSYIAGVIDTYQARGSDDFCLVDHGWFSEPTGPTRALAVISIYESLRSTNEAGDIAAPDAIREMLSSRYPCAAKR